MHGHQYIFKTHHRLSLVRRAMTTTELKSIHVIRFPVMCKQTFVNVGRQSADEDLPREPLLPSDPVSGGARPRRRERPRRRRRRHVSSSSSAAASAGRAAPADDVVVPVVLLMVLLRVVVVVRRLVSVVMVLLLLKDVVKTIVIHIFKEIDFTLEWTKK